MKKKNIFWQKKNSIENTVFCITVDILWVLISFRKLGLKFLKYFQYCYRVFFSQAKKLLMRKKMIFSTQKPKNGWNMKIVSITVLDAKNCLIIIIKKIEALSETPLKEIILVFTQGIKTRVELKMKPFNWNITISTEV